ncbi:ABC transporter [Truncatella angustata]|uniref:ABC transporter n=1 Tax=Truncatella angustata TaxID=152316 RepID=A0A9P8UEN5_9PEZI|nr:ABC transporter [Truncatella angustata]KAH6648570.1 ABC transporter [Truncatella angustata]
MRSFYAHGYEVQNLLAGESGFSQDSHFVTHKNLQILESTPFTHSVTDSRYSFITQASIAGALVLIYLIRLSLPAAPQWCSKFAQEDAWQNAPRTRRWSFPAVALLLLSIAGLALATVSAIYENSWAWLGLVPWLASVLLVVIARPSKTPKTLLTILCTTTLSNAFALYANYKTLRELNIIYLGELCIAIGYIIIILSMPMRDPGLSAEGIAGPHDKATNKLRSPEDKLTLWQFMTVSWMGPMMRVASKKTLNDEDVWLLPFEFQHSRLHMLFQDLRGSLIWRLILANGLDLMITTSLGILEMVANLSNPVLLQRLIASIQNGSRNESIFYAITILAVRLVAAQSAVFTLWYSRRAYERSRGEMITTVYAKTLTRKSQGFQPSENDPKHVNGNELDGGKVEEGRFARLLIWLKIRKSRSEKAETAKAPASMGKILNLMRSDCYEVAQRFWDFPALITKPLQFGLSLFLVWQFLGWPCLLGLAWVVFIQLLNGLSVKALISREKRRRAATDERLQATSQFVEAIRHLRWYDWQGKWLDKIMVARDSELHLKIITGLWAVLLGTINISAGALFPVITFFGYTYIAGRPLSVDIAFPALQLFNMLETSLKELPDLFMMLLNASVAIGRLDAFMAEPDKDEGFSNEEATDIEFRDASFAWPGTNNPVLYDLNLHFTTGLAVILGQVGSGKSALLQGILGELDRWAGDCILPHEMVGYCAQSPWLQHMSIRDNILFSSPYDPVRYKQVIEACQLTTDLASFEHGDLSFIGENGIGLSGGQKARVALARAVYSQSRILLLDDPLAPLDHNTAETIVQKLFRGSLVEGRTVVLVTHRVDLVTHLADQVIEIQDGKGRILDIDEIPEQIATSKSANNPEEAHEAEPSAEEQDAAIRDKFIEEEHRKDGGVVLSVYWTYIRAGKLRWWAVLIVLFTIFRLARVFSGWFLKAFSEAYPDKQVDMDMDVAFLARRVVFAIVERGRDGSGSFADRFFDNLPPPYENVRPWLIWYLVIALAMTALFTIVQLALLLILYVAAKSLYVQVVTRVSNATFRFYDVTPVGRLMNRLTSDIGMLDGGIISPLQNMAFFFLTWATAMVIIALVTPIFFIFAIVMTLGFVYIFLQFLPASQSLRRLEMVSLSPLMSNFGILLDGLATIRAFKAQPNFQNRNIVVTDAFQQKDHFYWSLQSWLMYRFDSLSAVSTFVLTMIALYNGLSPGLTAFVLTTAAQFVDATHMLCKVYGQLQMDFVSVERVIELLELEEEQVGDIDPPAHWPAFGDDIEFDNVTMKYAPHLEPSLSDVSFKIPGGSTCAVLGRTGSGKSTLALALLATLRPETGSIHVGSMDISRVNVHTWRQRISFVAQDPVLFPGTLRQNIDPLEEHSDAECIAVLHRILGPEWSLTSHVEGGGKNLSQGQRQLVGIGRAVLRRSSVVVLDEATASIDKKTALAIQDVLRDELKQSTVITIAHRLEAVKDADWYVRLDAGRVVECGPAKNLPPPSDTK